MAVQDEGSDATPQHKASNNVLLRLARDHLALLVPIVGALIFAFRCVIVSEGDIYVAFILATETAVGDAIRALLFTVIPILLFALAYVVGFASATRIVEAKFEREHERLLEQDRARELRKRDQAKDGPQEPREAPSKPRSPVE